MMQIFQSYATPRVAIMAVFAAFGSVVGVLAGSVPQLMTQSNLTNSSYGLGVTLMTAATILAMGFAGTMARFLSHRALILILLPLKMSMMFVILTGSSTLLFFIIAPLFGLASGAMDVIMNAEGGAIEKDVGKPIYTAFHGSVSISLAFFAILSSLLSTLYGPWLSALAAAVMVAATMFIVYRALPARPLPIVIKGEAKAKRNFTLPIVLMGTAAGLTIACEVTAFFWSSELLATTAPQFAAISGLGAAFFGLCNAIVRFPGDYLRARFGEIRLMSTTIVIAIIGFIGLGLTTSFAANVFFFAMTGFGLAIVCPCLFAMAAQETPHNRAAGLGAALLVAGVPRIITPTLFGAVAEQFSTRVAFGLCALMALCALGTIQALKNLRKEA